MKCCKERTSPFAFSYGAAGSLTIETALALPVFMLFVVAMISFLVIINLQTSIQLKMEEAARQLGKSAYALDLAKESEQNSLSGLGINFLSIRAAVLDADLSTKANASRITGGASGISLLSSDFDEDCGTLDIKASYNYSMPFLPSGIGELSFSQRSYSRAWVGKSLTEGKGSSSEEGEDDDTIVYVTVTGTVYHTSENCNYLDLSIRAVDYSEVDYLRNKSGSKYEKCSCCKGDTYSTVYVTDYGTNYHASLTCSGLKRTVMEVKLSEVGDMKICSKCAGNH